MRVLIAGDFCPVNRVEKLFNNHQFEKVLGDVRGVIEQFDYSVVNFECPVVESDANPILKQGPNICCSRNGLEALKYAGFDCITLANNHFYDYGEAGVRDTITSCNTLQIDTVGGG